VHGGGGRCEYGQCESGETDMGTNWIDVKIWILRRETIELRMKVKRSVELKEDDNHTDNQAPEGQKPREIGWEIKTVVDTGAGHGKTDKKTKKSAE
jgi:hypothetical protein